MFSIPSLAVSRLFFWPSGVERIFSIPMSSVSWFPFVHPEWNECFLFQLYQLHCFSFGIQE